MSGAFKTEIPAHGAASNSRVGVRYPCCCAHGVDLRCDGTSKEMERDRRKTAVFKTNLRFLWSRGHANIRSIRSKALAKGLSRIGRAIHVPEGRAHKDFFAHWFDNGVTSRVGSLATLGRFWEGEKARRSMGSALAAVDSIWPTRMLSRYQFFARASVTEMLRLQRHLQQPVSRCCRYAATA